MHIMSVSLRILSAAFRHVFVERGGREEVECDDLLVNGYGGYLCGEKAFVNCLENSIGDKSDMNLIMDIITYDYI